MKADDDIRKPDKVIFTGRLTGIRFEYPNKLSAMVDLILLILLIIGGLYLMEFVS